MTSDWGKHHYDYFGKSKMNDVTSHASPLYKRRWIAWNKAYWLCSSTSNNQRRYSVFATLTSKLRIINILFILFIFAAHKKSNNNTMESTLRISNLLSIVALFCCSSLLTVAHAASISNRNSGCSASATSLTPSQMDIKLAEKLAAFGKDKSAIPDFNLNKLTVNPQMGHLPCPRDHSDPQRWTSSATNIINIIPWYVPLFTSFCYTVFMSMEMHFIHA